MKYETLLSWLPSVGMDIGRSQSVSVKGKQMGIRKDMTVEANKSGHRERGLHTEHAPGMVQVRVLCAISSLQH